MSKKSLALSLLNKESAPRVFSPSSISDYFTKNNCSIPTRSLTQALSDWNEAGVIKKINSHVYMNNLATPSVRPDEAAQFLRPLAVVSLARVLGEAGVINNPSHFITCVMPIEKSRKSGVNKLNDHTFIFSAMPQVFFPDKTSDIFEDCFDDSIYPKSTPEKAIVDWIYLASNGKNRYHLPKGYDWDWDMINESRLKRLIEHFALENKWDLVREEISGPDFKKKKLKIN